jgi:glycosyltransferase involved in cell wall biosynthesis
MRGEFDILHYHAIGPGALAALPRVASRAKVVLTLHGLDEERAKWGRGARAVLKAAGWVSARAPNAIIAVSRDLQRHYREVRGRPTLYIPNGVCAPAPDPAGRVLDRFGLGAGGYLLFVGRLVPEKAPDLLVRAYRQVPGDHRLVLVGGSSFTGACTEQLRRLAAEDDRVVLADPEGERRGAAALRERVVRAYDWDEAAAATERVYRLLVDGSTVHAGRAAAIADPYRVNGGQEVARP